MSRTAVPTLALLCTLTAAPALGAPASADDGRTPADVPPADFEKLHAAAGDDPNRFLILGGVKVVEPPAGVSADLRAFLGRWEGANTNPPVKNDLKVALAIRSIDGDRADAFIYYGYNLQFPTAVKHLSFKVTRSGGAPCLEAALQPGADPKASGHVKVSVQQGAGSLTGEIALGSGTANYVGATTANPIALSRGSSYNVYKDYPAYLASIRIHAETYRNAALSKYGSGYLVYLPPGYEADTGKRWPLMIYMHGMGDRGDNIYLVAKASPYKMIREKGPLPFIIVSPLLASSPDFFSFPGEYLEGVLDEVTKGYRVDEKRVYLAGLSLGGEAAFRFSMEHPEKIAAMASLGGMLAIHVPQYYKREIKELEGIPLSRLKDVPAWDLHGTGDAIVPVELARGLVDAFAKAGVTVKYTELKDHEHDIWSDTLADPAFYDWFLQHRKQ